MSHPLQINTERRGSFELPIIAQDDGLIWTSTQRADDEIISSKTQSYLGHTWNNVILEGHLAEQTVGYFCFLYRTLLDKYNAVIVPTGFMTLERGVGSFSSAQAVLEEVSRLNNSILMLVLPSTGQHRSAKDDIEKRGYQHTGRGIGIETRGLNLFTHIKSRSCTDDLLASLTFESTTH